MGFNLERAQTSENCFSLSRGTSLFFQKQKFNFQTHNFFLQTLKINLNFEILSIRSLNRSLQSTRFRVLADWHRQKEPQNHRQTDIATYRLTWTRGQLTEEKYSLCSDNVQSVWGGHSGPSLQCNFSKLK